MGWRSWPRWRISSSISTASSNPLTSPRRPRRRVDRPSPAENIDRSVDFPDGRFNIPGGDEERTVLLDPDAEEELQAEEFWKEQQPPHHG